MEHRARCYFDLTILPYLTGEYSLNIITFTKKYGKFIKNIIVPYLLVNDICNSIIDEDLDIEYSTTLCPNIVNRSSILRYKFYMKGNNNLQAKIRLYKDINFNAFVIKVNFDQGLEKWLIYPRVLYVNINSDNIIKQSDVYLLINRLDKYNTNWREYRISDKVLGIDDKFIEYCLQKYNVMIWLL